MSSPMSQGRRGAWDSRIRLTGKPSVPAPASPAPRTEFA